VSAEYRVISIGTLSRHRLWGEPAAVRTAHATTTLVVEDDRRILVDPSLPGTILSARFAERTGRGLESVTDVFCTTLRPVHRRGLPALTHAKWWTGERELSTYRGHLVALKEAADRLDEAGAEAVEDDLRLTDRFSAAPEQFSRQVQVMPMYGASVGSCGLLLTPVITTVVVAGDAAPTREHIEAGQVWQGCADRDAAIRSLQDLLELADVIVPGHDNVVLCARRWL